MFGEEEIYGQEELCLDGKKRVFLPRFTKATVGDSLLIVEEDDFISIYEKNTYINKIKELEERIDNCFDSFERGILELSLMLMYYDVIKEVKCDSQKKVSLNNISLEKEKFMCEGAKDHLLLKVKKNQNSII